MSAAKVVNLLKSHLHLAGLNRAIPPGGFAVFERSLVEKNPEVLACVKAGYLSVLAEDGTSIIESPAKPEPPVAPEHKVDTSSTIRTEDGPVKVNAKPREATVSPAKEKAKEKEFIGGIEVLNLAGKNKVPEFLEGVEIERGEPDEEILPEDLEATS